MNNINLHKYYLFNGKEVSKMKQTAAGAIGILLLKKFFVQVNEIINFYLSFIF
jgi:hypothetical protein